MRAYNVDIFTNTFDLVFHTNVNSIEYKEDYIKPSVSEMTILIDDFTTIKSGQYIRIYGNNDDYFGLIDSVSSETDGQAKISFVSFLTKFDQEAIYDLNLQGKSSMEQSIADILTGIWLNNSDSAEMIPNLYISLATSNIRNWTLNLSADSQNTHYKKISSVFDTFILNGMQKYNIYINVIPDYVNKSIKLVIGSSSVIEKTIEADLPNITKKTIVVSNTSEKTNKLIVYDATLGESMINSPITYYLHSDDSYDKSNSDRVTPVNRSVSIVSSSTDNSFETLAKQSADSVLGTNNYSNYIELTVASDDTLANPSGISYGQNVYVIHNGIKYVSVLTGREVSKGTTKLIFGTLRLSLTSIL